jgi:hypothetical protein
MTKQQDNDKEEIEDIETPETETAGGRYGEALYGEETVEEDKLNGEEAGLDAGLGRDARQQSDMDEIGGDMVETASDDMDEIVNPNAIDSEDEEDVDDDLEETEEENPELMDVPM